MTASKYPLATREGIHALDLILSADNWWRVLTRPQQELLLSCVAGFPIKARVDVYARLVDHGLLIGDYVPTEAGRCVVEWRLP